jgi:hypothetical protein
MTITVAIINRTARIRDARIEALLPALFAQANEDFCPAWKHESVAFSFVGSLTRTLPSTNQRLWFYNNSDDPGALGYHEDDTGLPEGKVFVEEAIRDGASISVTASHELLEMLADPLTTTYGPTIGGQQYNVEVGDPVEADEDGYLKLGVLMSNFTLPAYYELGSVGPWDFRKLLLGPLPDMRPGGYLGWRNVSTGMFGQTNARYADGTMSSRAIRPHGRNWRRASKHKVS